MPARLRGTTVARGALCLALTCWAWPLGAQRSDGPAWAVVAPDAATAWFAVLADWRIDGDGAFSFIAPRQPAGARDEALARRIRDDVTRGVLHFVPLYFPSAQRADLAASLRASASASASPNPRGTFLVSAFERAMPAARRREYLVPLAAALEAVSISTLSATRLTFLQQRLDSVFLPALAPHLARERLDAGRLIVASGIGAEGRLFSGTSDRADNLIAVGDFSGDLDPEAPLLAFARESCFPAVSRAATSAGIGADSPGAARRSSLAAVRCGAALLEACIPARAATYRAFWLRQASLAGLRARSASIPVDIAAQRAEFDRVFPPDAALRVPAGCARAAPQS